MKTEEILIYGREDMIYGCHKKDIQDIDSNDFTFSIKPFQIYGIILFIDDGGQTKILKNRYGSL